MDYRIVYMKILQMSSTVSHLVSIIYVFVHHVFSKKLKSLETPNHGHMAANSFSSTPRNYIGA